MTRRPSLANSTDLCLKRADSAQIAQISTDTQSESVLTFPQVKAYKSAFSTDSTDFYGLTSRVEIGGVSPGRVSPDAVCRAHMQKSVLSVLTPPAANFAARPADSGGRRGADRRE
ncbi:hypothetical protein SEA_ELLIE_66 [Mycobacterium phage Ellie]|uniref:Uncharacterized protein n=1 Tax=Mycobacterium phage Ellie TaxID=2762405 RepID=A0A7G8LM49_9CAUD|nr:hypothetical protein I5G88_gp66 [Mycobacterium phage Ellie]QNJ58321.1 hypothetical protein SEA_ELLIE_66 [Mycobacterium phage Ellie]